MAFGLAHGQAIDAPLLALLPAAAASGTFVDHMIYDGHPKEMFDVGLD
jgi:hypothetical protein